MSVEQEPGAQFTVSSASRADIAVSRELGLSRRQLKQLFEDKRVRVDGRLARKGDIVAPGQVIDVCKLPSSRRPTPSEMDIEVLFEDDDLIVINKPADIATHPLVSGEVDTAANWLVARYPETIGIGDDEREAGWVHRLDRGTSGVLVAARNREMWLALRELFSESRVTKRYLALVDGQASDGESRAPLRRAGRRTVVCADDDVDSLEAETRWRVDRPLGARTLVSIDLVTGRMHQIRAHLAHAGHPICGDELYGGSPLAGHNQFLHAAELSFAHPRSGALISVVAPLPPDRLALLHSLG